MISREEIEKWKRWIENPALELRINVMAREAVPALIEENEQLRARVEKYRENDYVLIAAAASNLGFNLVADKRLSGAVWSEFTDKLDALKAERDALRARLDDYEYTAKREGPLRGRLNELLSEHEPGGLILQQAGDEIESLRARVEELEGKSGHWTKEPPTTPGWYFVHDGRPKRPLFACVDRRIGDNELIFNCLGWAHDCKLEGQTIVKWWWSEPLELPEPPEEQSHAEI